MVWPLPLSGEAHQPTCLLLESESEIDRAVVVKSDSINIRHIRRQVLRIHIEDPLLGSRIPSERRIRCCRGYSFVNLIYCTCATDN